MDVANPQAEHGHTRTANEIMEALARTHLRPREWQVLNVVLRECYGRNGGRKSAPLSIHDIAQATGLSRQHAWDGLHGLQEKNLVKRNAGEVGLQKDYDQWRTRSEKSNGNHNQSVPDTGYENVPEIGTKQYPKSGTNVPEIGTNRTLNREKSVPEIGTIKETVGRNKENNETLPATAFPGDSPGPPLPSTGEPKPWSPLFNLKDLWDRYPEHRRGDHITAELRELWHALSHEEQQESVLKLEELKHSHKWLEREGEFVPGIVKYLKQRRWKSAPVTHWREVEELHAYFITKGELDPSLHALTPERRRVAAERYAKALGVNPQRAMEIMKDVIDLYVADPRRQGQPGKMSFDGALGTTESFEKRVNRLNYPD
jgi:phage replication O-like protein O